MSHSYLYRFNRMVKTAAVEKSDTYQTIQNRGNLGPQNWKPPLFSLSVAVYIISLIASQNLSMPRSLFIHQVVTEFQLYVLEI